MNAAHLLAAGGLVGAGGYGGRCRCRVGCRCVLRFRMAATQCDRCDQQNPDSNDLCLAFIHKFTFAVRAHLRRRIDIARTTRKVTASVKIPENRGRESAYLMGLLLYSLIDQRYAARVIPMLQATAAIALCPTAPPVSNLRTASVTGVNGWYSANCRSPVGIESVGTNPLPRNGSRVRNIGVLLAVSTLFAARPSAVDSHIRALAKSSSIPSAA